MNSATRLRSMAAVVVLGAGLSSCSAPESASPGPAGRRVGLVEPGGPLGFASDGLAVRELRVAEDAERTAAALAVHTTPALDENTAERLARNGLRLVRVNDDALDGLLAALGPAYGDVDGWHGQVTEWQSLRSVPVAASGRAVAADGRMRRLAGGRVDLLMRGFTIRMEDGPRFQLELVPEHARTQRSRLARVLGDDADRGERFDGAAIETLLDPGSVYALTTLPPGYPVRPVAIDEAESSDTSSSSRGARTVGETPGRTIGPDAGSVITIGEFLLREKPVAASEATAPVTIFGSDGEPVNLPSDAMLPGMRRVILFAPRVPPHLVPEPLA